MFPRVSANHNINAKHKGGRIKNPALFLIQNPMKNLYKIITDLLGTDVFVHRNH